MGRDQAIFKTVFQTGPGSINIYSNDNCMSSLPGSVFSLDLVFFFLIVLGTLLVGDCGLGKDRTRAHLVVLLSFPCNQFEHQKSAKNEEILNYLKYV